MSKKHGLSRRATLQGLGAAGAAMVLGSVATSAEKEAASGPENTELTPDVVELAVDRMKKGHSCAQAVFTAFAEQMGMDYLTAMKLTSGFGGGMRLGSVCGSVTGGIMAIGLKQGGVGEKPSKETARLVREFADRFKSRHQSINCPELLGVDLSTPEGLQTAKEKKAFAVCPGIVKDAATILHELLNETEPRKEG